MIVAVILVGSVFGAGMITGQGGFSSLGHGIKSVVHKLHKHKQ